MVIRTDIQHPGTGVAFHLPPPVTPAAQQTGRDPGIPAAFPGGLPTAGLPAFSAHGQGDMAILTARSPIRVRRCRPIDSFGARS